LAQVIRGWVGSILTDQRKKKVFLRYPKKAKFKGFRLKRVKDFR